MNGFNYATKWLLKNKTKKPEADWELRATSPGKGHKIGPFLPFPIQVRTQVVYKSLLSF